MILGIDEAGRGPVIGPLAMCGLLCDNEDELAQLGVKDSKLLTPQQREALAKKLENYKHHLILLSPEEIDEAINNKNSNLNWLEADTIAKIINKMQPAKAIIDCPSPNISAYTSYVKKRLHQPVKLVIEHKADVNHPVVSAASILAKVARDKEIELLKKKVGTDFGNGYMTDPNTLAFLEKNWHRYPHLFRTSWAPFKKLVAKQAQKELGEFK